LRLVAVKRRRIVKAASTVEVICLPGDKLLISRNHVLNGCQVRHTYGGRII
jgi:hypothetical protein